MEKGGNAGGILNSQAIKEKGIYLVLLGVYFDYLEVVGIIAAAVVAYGEFLEFLEFSPIHANRHAVAAFAALGTMNGCYVFHV